MLNLFYEFLIFFFLPFFYQYRNIVWEKYHAGGVPTSFLSVFIKGEHKGTVYFYDSGSWLFSFAVEKNVYYFYKIGFIKKE